MGLSQDTECSDTTHYNTLPGHTGFLPGIFSGGQNLLLCKFLLLRYFFYSFQTKFVLFFGEGGKLFEGGASPVEESQHRQTKKYFLPGIGLQT